MLSIYDPLYYKSFAIDLTNRCNAKCGFCARENKELVETLSDLNPELFYKIFNPDYIKNMEKLVINGNLGEPSLSEYFVEYLIYISKTNPDCYLWISTNGSTKNKGWWKKIAHILSYNPKNVVRFCIDGIGKTHEVYRHTQYNRIIENLESFNSAGGNSEWQFIMFQHNEHQLDEARAKAKEIGCKGFVKLVSRRYNQVFRRPENLDVKTKTELCSNSSEALCCTPINLKNLYLSHRGFLFPCCDFAYLYDKKPKVYIQYLKSLDKIDLTKSSLTEAINSPFFKYVYNNINSLSVCMTGCRIQNNNFNDLVMQWENLEQKKESLNKQ